MTGTTSVKPAQTNEQWARNVDTRIQSVEHPTTARVGQWVLATDDNTGNLIASNVNGGSVILTEPPPGGVDPDAISTTGQPYIRCSLVNGQAVAAATLTNIAWDSVQVATSEWQFTAPGTDLVIPRSGVYQVILNVYSVTSGALGAQTAIAININGSAFTLSEPAISENRMARGCSDMLRLGAGDVITGQILITSGGGYTIGVSPRGPNAYTSICLKRLDVDI